MNTNEPETTDGFVSRLRLQAAYCEFLKTKRREEYNSEFDKRLIEQIIAGTIYPEVQQKLPGEDFLKNDTGESYSSGKKTRSIN